MRRPFFILVKVHVTLCLDSMGGALARVRRRETSAARSSGAEVRRGAEVGSSGAGLRRGAGARGAGSGMRCAIHGAPGAGRRTQVAGHGRGARDAGRESRGGARGAGRDWRDAGCGAPGGSI